MLLHAIRCDLDARFGSTSAATFESVCGFLRGHDRTATLVDARIRQVPWRCCAPIINRQKGGEVLKRSLGLRDELLIAQVR